MALKVSKFDPAEFLQSDGARTEYMRLALESGDKAEIARALGVVARAKGMSAVAKETRLAREGLYKTLSAEGNPELDTLLKVFAALNLTLTVKPAERTKRARGKRRKAA